MVLESCIKLISSGLSNISGKFVISKPKKKEKKKEEDKTGLLPS